MDIHNSFARSFYTVLFMQQKDTLPYTKNSAGNFYKRWKICYCSLEILR